jgi:Protein of unknown function (DUF4230)
MKKLTFNSIKERLRKIPFGKFWKGLPKIAKAVLLLVMAWLLLRLFNIVPSFGNLFRSQPVLIEDSPILIKEIKPLAELTTIISYDEVVVDSVKVTDKNVKLELFNQILPAPLLPNVIPRIVIIGKGKVIAGIDLKAMPDSNIVIRKDSVHLVLPDARILDVIINPSDFETFDEDGDWSAAEVQAIKSRAKDKLLQRALNRQILQKANAKGKAVMENFLRSVGYKKVTVVQRVH